MQAGSCRSAPSVATTVIACACLLAPAAVSGQEAGSLWLTTTNAGALSRFSQIVRAADGSHAAVGLRGGDTVVLRRLDGDGTPVGAETQVARGSAPAIAAFADGALLVTWRAPAPPTFSLTAPVMGQLFDAAGRAVGTPLALGSTASAATPTALADGRFVLATFGHVSRVSGPSGFLRTYTRQGAEAGPSAALHEDACGLQGPPAVAALPAGGFTVAWPYACVAAPQIRLRTYGADGAVVASSRMTVGQQGDTATVALAPLAGGTVALQWTLGAPAAVRELLTMVVAPASLPGSPAGATRVPLQPGRTPGPVQATPDGGYVIPWSASDASEARVPVSRFSGAGAPLQAF